MRSQLYILVSVLLISSTILSAQPSALTDRIDSLHAHLLGRGVGGEASYFGPPLDSTLTVIGTFGEIRDDHFHSGLDLGTGEVTGKNVYAAADGYVSRIKIAADGFGKALYITHPNGYVTVYAHLQKFNPVLEKYINKLQYEQETFAIDHTTTPFALPVRKGEVIALSGNTGGSSGPHLHFEIRDAKTEWPINPLLFGYAIEDVVSPILSKVKIFSLHHQGAVINAIESASYKVSAESGEYKLLGPQVINVFGPIGLGIEAIDKMNSPLDKAVLGIYSIELKLDGVRKYFFKFDTFSFDETRYANAHIDYEEEVLNNATIQRCFLLPGNNLSIDAASMGDGELMLSDGQLHSAEFIVNDFAGNAISMYVGLQSHLPLSTISFPYPPDDVSVISEGKGININAEDVHIRIPMGVVYDETWFTFSKSKGSPAAYSSLHHIGESTVAVHNQYTLEIKTNNISPALQPKAVIVSYRKDGTPRYEGGEWTTGGFVSATVRRFGDFEVLLDTTPPVIQTLAVEMVNPTIHINNIRPVTFLLKDNLSGIASYKATIDGKFHLLEYDAKTGTLYGELPAPKKNQKHPFVLTVTDKRGNTSTYKQTDTF